MDVRKLDAVLDMALNEALPADLDDMIIRCLKEYQDEILESVADYISENEEDVAEQAGYKCYCGDGFQDNALVLDVKGRPDIDADVVGRENNEDFWNEINLALADFADRLKEEIPGFTIRGRMGGYWGISDLDHNIDITDHGYELMKVKTLELLNDPELMYNGAMEEAQTDEDRESVIYDVLNYDLTVVSNALITGDDTIEIKPEFLARMNELSDLIDKQEAEMQKPEFWQREE